MKRLMLVLWLAAGCGSTVTHHVVTGTPKEAYSGEVRVVLESAPVPANLDEVAIVQAVGHGTDANLESIIEGLKEEARALGCDTVVRVRIDQGTATASASGVAARTRAVTRSAPAAAPAPVASPTPAVAPAPAVAPTAAPASEKADKDD